MIYIVMPGDTLTSIAENFDTNVSALLELNPQVINPDTIFPGQIIVVSYEVPTPPTPVCPLLQRGSRGSDVVRLQTLLRVAGFHPGPSDGIFGFRTQRALIAFQRSIREIEVIPGVADFETWTALGAECIPGPVISPGVVKYIVRPGESLYIIGARFDVTVQEILQANPQITTPSLIFAGQEISIPIR